MRRLPRNQEVKGFLWRHDRDRERGWKWRCKREERKWFKGHRFCSWSTWLVMSISLFVSPLSENAWLKESFSYPEVIFNVNHSVLDSSRRDDDEFVRQTRDPHGKKRYCNVFFHEVNVSISLWRATRTRELFLQQNDHSANDDYDEKYHFRSFPCRGQMSKLCIKSSFHPFQYFIYIPYFDFWFFHHSTLHHSTYSWWFWWK